MQSVTKNLDFRELWVSQLANVILLKSVRWDLHQQGFCQTYLFGLSYIHFLSCFFIPYHWISQHYALNMLLNIQAIALKDELELI